MREDQKELVAGIDGTMVSVEVDIKYKVQLMRLPDIAMKCKWYE